MEGARFLVPVIPVAVAFIPIGLIHLTDSKVLQRIVLLALLAVQIIAVVNFASRASSGVPVWRSTRFAEPYDSDSFAWFERRNRVNARDIPLIHHLKQYVGQIVSHRDGPVYLMSGQMGIVPYYIAREYYGRVQIIDRVGLTDKAFSNCTITRNLPKNAWGQEVTYITFFANKDGLKQRCGIVTPDIIFDVIDLEAAKSEDFTNNGFTIIYEQTGKVFDAELLGGMTVLADEYIAVRNDLLTALDSSEPIHLDFSELQR